jgi:hypothetical protein
VDVKLLKIFLLSQSVMFEIGLSGIIPSPHNNKAPTGSRGLGVVSDLIRAFLLHDLIFLEIAP